MLEEHTDGGQGKPNWWVDAAPPVPDLMAGIPYGVNTLDSHKILFGSMYPYRLTSTGLKIFDMLNLKKQYLNLIFNHNARSILKI